MAPGNTQPVCLRWEPPGQEEWIDVPEVGVRIRRRDGPPPGGFGRVFFGEHRHFQVEGPDGVLQPLPVAVKFCDPKPLLDPHISGPQRQTLWQFYLDLFGREAGRTAAHSDCHLITTLGYSRLDKHPDWRPVMVMQRADLSLAEVLKSDGPLPLALIRRIILQTAQGLHALHSPPFGLAHSDIKPANLFLRFLDGLGPSSGTPLRESLTSREFDVAVGDLGVAQRIDATAGLKFGEDSYKAPEQLTGSRPDVRSDLFGLGRVLQRLLDRCEGPRPMSLETLARRCTADAVGDRPVSAAEVIREVDRIGYRERTYQVGLAETVERQPTDYIVRHTIEAAHEQVASGPDYRVLYLKGGPGSGKSTAVAYLASRKAHGPAFFLNSVSRPSLEAAVGNLWRALNEDFGLNVTAPSRFTEAELSALLQMIEEQRRDWFQPGEWLWLYLDALDEADAPHEYRQFLPTQLPRCVKLVVSSRHEPRFGDLERGTACVVVDLDDPARRQGNVAEAAQFGERLLDGQLPDLARRVAEVFAGNFLMVRVVCQALAERAREGEKINVDAVSRELERVPAGDGAAQTHAEEPFHHLYREYFWMRIERQCRRHAKVTIRDGEEVAGLLAVGELAVPVDLLRALVEQGTPVKEALDLLRPFLLRTDTLGPNGRSLEAYRYAHKTFQTFITSVHGPISDPERVVELRQRVLEHYRQQPAERWDHFGLAAFIRLCLRQGRPELAVEVLKRHDFLDACVQAEGLGVDALREMVRRVREVVD